MRRVVHLVVAVATTLGVLVVAGPAAAQPRGLEVKGSTSAASSSDKSRTVTCPTGKVVTGGGGYLTAPANAKGYVGLDRMQPSATGTSFTATMREVGSVNYPGSWQLTTRAMCSPRPSGYQIVSATTSPGSFFFQTANASCGTKSLIGLGGRVNGGNGHVMLSDLIPANDLKSAYAVGHEVKEGYSGNWSVTVYAICADTPAGLERVQHVIPHNHDPHKAIALSCPGDKGLYSAGYDIVPGSSVLLSGLNILTTDKASVWADEEHSGYDWTWALFMWVICAN